MESIHPDSHLSSSPHYNPPLLFHVCICGALHTSMFAREREAGSEKL